MILEALVRAMDRREEVFQVVEDSEDADKASRRGVNSWTWEHWAAG